MRGGTRIGGRVFKQKPKYQFLPDAERIQARAESLVDKLEKKGARPKPGDQSFSDQLSEITDIADRYGHIGDLLRSEHGQELVAHLLKQELFLTETLPESRSHEEDLMQKGAVQMLRSILRSLNLLSIGLSTTQRAWRAWENVTTATQAAKAKMMG